MVGMKSGITIDMATESGCGRNRPTSNSFLSQIKVHRLQPHGLYCVGAGIRLIFCFSDT